MSHTALQPEIEDIQKRLQRVTSENYAKQLSDILHRTGWTDTQAHLVGVILDSLVHQLEGIEQAQRALIQAAGEIGNTKASKAT